MGIQCFYCEETCKVRLYLRRYVDSKKAECPGGSYHDARVYLRTVEQSPRTYLESHRWLLDDPRWPTRCDVCGHEFENSDRRQVFSERVYIRSDTGEELTLADNVPGMMWDAWWYGRKGPDGRALMTVLPTGHHWFIDGSATNCTKPENHEHYCWCRHGEIPLITVDKSGNTCDAGAGSIQAGDYHGFLRNGVFDP